MIKADYKMEGDLFIVISYCDYLPGNQVFLPFSPPFFF